MNKQIKRTMGSGLDKSLPFTCYARCKESYEYVIPIIGQIEEVSDFIEAVAMIEAAEEKDTVILKINSPGGNLAATDYLLQALAQTPAHIHAECSGELMSAATLIMEYVDSFSISDNTFILIHNSMFGEGGKHNDVVTAVAFADKMNKRFLDRYYKHMFNDEEMQQLYDGKQFYLDNNEYIDRFTKRREIMSEQEEQDEESVAESNGCNCSMACCKANHPLPEDQHTQV